jgi:hypothetical protein
VTESHKDYSARKMKKKKMNGISATEPVSVIAAFQTYIQNARGSDVFRFDEYHDLRMKDE